MPRGGQRINGVEYVYEYESTWNSDKKYGTHKRNYIGKMVDDVFMPNKKYRLQQELEVEKKKSPLTLQANWGLACPAMRAKKTSGQAPS